MSVDDEPTRRFEEHRARLVGVADRILGSAAAADDAVQETLQLLAQEAFPHREDLGGRLTALLARVCLDMLRGRAAESVSPLEGASGGADALAGSAPAERVAFVLHDVCAVPVEEVAEILGRTPTATRQLAGRARRRVESPERSPDADRTVHSRVVDAFLTASRAGDLDELVWLLHPEAVLHADADAVPTARAAGTRGAQAVAETFSLRARDARPVQLDGFAAAARSVGGQPTEVLAFTVVDGRIAEIELIAEPEALSRLDLRT